MTTAAPIRAAKATPPKVRAIAGVSATARIEAADSTKPAKISIIANTGEPMRLLGFEHPVVINMATAEMPGIAPVLSDHRMAMDAFAGQVAPKIVDKKIVADGFLVRGVPAADRAITLSRGGATLEASVGGPSRDYEFYDAGETVSVNGREFEGPLYVADGFRLDEISLVVKGADGKTTVSIAAKRHTAQGGASKMNKFEKWLRGMGYDPETMDQELKANLRCGFDSMRGDGKKNGAPEMVQAERERVAAIEAACSGDWGGGDVQAQVQYLRGRAIRGEITYSELLSGLDDSRKLGELRSAQRHTTDGILNGGIRGHRSGIDTRKVLLAGVLRLSGESAIGEKILGAEAMNAAEDAGIESVADIAAACLRMEGRDIPNGRSAVIRAGFSTVSMPTLIGGGLERTLAQRFQDSPASWRPFTAKRPLKDFKPTAHTRANFSAKLIEIGASGEIKHAKLDEEAIATLRNRTFARQYTLTRQMLINDDLGVFADLSRTLAEAALTTHADLVYETIKNGLSTHWTVGRGNLLSGGSSAFDIDALATGVKAMRLMTDANGFSINVAPAVLLVGPSLEKEARAVLQSLEVGRSDGGPTGNALKDIVSLAVEPRLELAYGFGASASTTRWFLFGGPATEPIIQTTLNGVEAPVVEILGPEHDPDTLGVTYRIYSDFSYSLGEYRASLMSVGA
ncbi:MAG: Mu-like prophage major head subunit gpT family protein [Phycisphaerales bacterium]|nr:Mu-like prophage major head subunit gpT family protein [Phycisphaerales bacterium]